MDAVSSGRRDTLTVLRAVRRSIGNRITVPIWASRCALSHTAMLGEAKHEFFRRYCDVPHTGLVHRRTSTVTKNPSVSVRRGVISRP